MENKGRAAAPKSNICECGGVLKLRRICRGKWYVSCPKCGNTLTRDYDSKQEAIEAWRQAAIEEFQPAELPAAKLPEEQRRRDAFVRGFLSVPESSFLHIQEGEKIGKKFIPYDDAVAMLWAAYKEIHPYFFQPGAAKEGMDAAELHFVISAIMRVNDARRAEFEIVPPKTFAAIDKLLEVGNYILEKVQRNMKNA